MSLPSGPLVGWLAGLLLHSVWIAAAAAALSWACLRWIRNPQAAHGSAVGGLLLVVAGMLTMGIATWPSRGGATAHVEAHAARIIQPASVPVPATPPAAASADLGAAGPEWQAWLVLAWGCGALAMSLRHACGWWQALRLRRTAIRLTGGLADRLAALCRAAGIDAPLLLASTRIAVPAAIGWWRPAILVPVELLTGLPPAQLDALLLHELAHLRRHDWLVEIAVSLIEGLFFFHPAVWWLGRRLRQARELCCDGLAVRTGAEPEGLARALFALAERHAPGSPALAASGGALAERVRRLLGLPERQVRPWRALAAIAVLPVLLAAIAACARGTAKAPGPETSPAEAYPLGNAETAPAFPLARRIRAHADGRQVHITARTIAAPAEFWSGLGLSGDGPQVLGSAQAARVLAAASTDPRAQVQSAPAIASLALRRSHASFISQFAYIADYRLVDAAPDPVLSVLHTGLVIRACAEPVADGVLLVEAGATSVDLLGAEALDFTWPVNGSGRSYPLEMPVCLIAEGRIASETRLGPGEAVAVPLQARIQRGRPNFRYAIEHGTIAKRIADPDPNAHLRSVCLFTAAASGPPEGGLAATPDAASWLDGTRVSLDLHDAPLDEAIRSLASQLPVQVAVDRDADYAATRVSLTARDEPVRAVLGRLLGQCLLEGSASAGQLRLRTGPFSDLPGPALGPEAATAQQASP